jgi:hypothetical protein
MRELLDQGVDPDDWEPEDAEYNPGMTDEQLDAAHADMQEFLKDTAPIETHRSMTWEDARELYARHGVDVDHMWDEFTIATVLGGLEAEILTLRAENKALRYIIAAELLKFNSEIDDMIANATTGTD